ncbi:MAG TPA: response regulator, partial [Chromatiaceae bacterium]|nr:response regulator [Chromatiaceae bacterium]
MKRSGDISYAARLRELILILTTAMARRLEEPLQRLTSRVTGFRGKEDSGSSNSVGAPERLIGESIEKNVPQTRENRRLAEQARLPHGASERAEAPAQAIQPTPRSRILLVEDNAVHQMITMSMLETLGCEVELARGGEEAVAKAGEQHFELIFMDCHMPGTDGFSASRQIREREPSQNHDRTPIIALTADFHEEIREHCRQAGMDDHLGKPYFREDLARILAKWLPGWESPEKSMEPTASPPRSTNRIRCWTRLGSTPCVRWGTNAAPASWRRRPGTTSTTCPGKSLDCGRRSGTGWRNRSAASPTTSSL